MTFSGSNELLINLRPSYPTALNLALKSVILTRKSLAGPGVGSNIRKERKRGEE